MADLSSVVTNRNNAVPSSDEDDEGGEILQFDERTALELLRKEAGDDYSDSGSADSTPPAPSKTPQLPTTDDTVTKSSQTSNRTLGTQPLSHLEGPQLNRPMATASDIQPAGLSSAATSEFSPRSAAPSVTYSENEQSSQVLVLCCKLEGVHKERQVLLECKEEAKRTRANAIQEVIAQITSQGVVNEKIFQVFQRYSKECEEKDKLAQMEYDRKLSGLQSETNILEQQLLALVQRSSAEAILKPEVQRIIIACGLSDKVGLPYLSGATVQPYSGSEELQRSCQKDAAKGSDVTEWISSLPLATSIATAVTTTTCSTTSLSATTSSSSASLSAGTSPNLATLSSDTMNSLMQMFPNIDAIRIQQTWEESQGSLQKTLDVLMQETKHSERDDTVSVPSISTGRSHSNHLRQKSPPKTPIEQKYMINTKINLDETDVTEFKDIFLNEQFFDRVTYAMRRTLNAFLNMNGGRMYFGVNDDGFVKGLHLHSHLRDQIRLAADEVMHRMYPQVDLKAVKYSINFVPVIDVHGYDIPERFVITASVAEDPFLEDIGVHFVDESRLDAYMRASASCQRMHRQLIGDKLRRANEIRKQRNMEPLPDLPANYSNDTPSFPRVAGRSPRSHYHPSGYESCHNTRSYSASRNSRHNSLSQGYHSEGSAQVSPPLRPRDKGNMRAGRYNNGSEPQPMHRIDEQQLLSSFIRQNEGLVHHHLNDGSDRPDRGGRDEREGGGGPFGWAQSRGSRASAGDLVRASASAPSLGSAGASSAPSSNVSTMLMKQRALIQKVVTDASTSSSSTISPTTAISSSTSSTPHYSNRTQDRDRGFRGGSGAISDGDGRRTPPHQRRPVRSPIFDDNITTSKSKTDSGAQQSIHFPSDGHDAPIMDVMSRFQSHQFAPQILRRPLPSESSAPLEGNQRTPTDIARRASGDASRRDSERSHEKRPTPQNAVFCDDIERARVSKATAAHTAASSSPSSAAFSSALAALFSPSPSSSARPRDNNDGRSSMEATTTNLSPFGSSSASSILKEPFQVKCTYVNDKYNDERQFRAVIPDHLVYKTLSVSPGARTCFVSFASKQQRDAFMAWNCKTGMLFGITAKEM